MGTSVLPVGQDDPFLAAAKTVVGPQGAAASDPFLEAARAVVPPRPKLTPDQQAEQQRHLIHPPHVTTEGEEYGRAAGEAGYDILSGLVNFPLQVIRKATGIFQRRPYPLPQTPEERFAGQVDPRVMAEHQRRAALAAKSEEPTAGQMAVGLLTMGYDLESAVREAAYQGGPETLRASINLGGNAALLAAGRLTEAARGPIVATADRAMATDIMARVRGGAMPTERPVVAPPEPEPAPAPAPEPAPAAAPEPAAAAAGEPAPSQAAVDRAYLRRQGFSPEQIADLEARATARAAAGEPAQRGAAFIEHNFREEPPAAAPPGKVEAPAAEAAPEVAPAAPVAGATERVTETAPPAAAEPQPTPPQLAMRPATGKSGIVGDARGNRFRVVDNTDPSLVRVEPLEGGGVRAMGRATVQDLGLPPEINPTTGALEPVAVETGGPVGEAEKPGVALHDAQGRVIPGSEAPEAPPAEPGPPGGIERRRAKAGDIFPEEVIQDRRRTYVHDEAGKITGREAPAAGPPPPADEFLAAARATAPPDAAVPAEPAPGVVAAGAPHDQAGMQATIFGGEEMVGKPQTELLPEGAGAARAEFPAGPAAEPPGVKPAELPLEAPAKPGPGEPPEPPAAGPVVQPPGGAAPKGPTPAEPGSAAALPEAEAPPVLDEWAQADAAAAKAAAKAARPPRARRITPREGSELEKFYKPYDEDWLVGRRKQIMDRITASSQQFNDNVTYATRETDSGMWSGTIFKNAAGRAIAAINRDARLLTEVESEMKRRGIPVEEVDNAAELSDFFAKARQAEEAGQPLPPGVPEGEGGFAARSVARTAAGAALGLGAGAILGATGDEKNPIKGAMWGLLAGAAVVNAPAAARAFIGTDFGKRFFTGAGAFPKEVFERDIMRKAEIAAGNERLGATVRDVHWALRSAFGKRMTTDQIAAVNDALAGKPAKLPLPIQRTVGALRATVDAWSHRLIEVGAASGDLADIIENNIGSYLTRSYRIFDDPAYGARLRKLVDKLNEGRPIGSGAEANLVNKTIAFLQDEMPKATPDEVLGQLGALLDKNVDSPLGALRQSKVGAKDLSIFKHREEIAPEIRALWGEYQDPLVNYARSVHKMMNLVANQRFLTDVRTSGMGRFLFKKATGTHTRLIAADNSSPMYPLNGLWTTPEIADAFNRSFASANLPNWLRLYLKANSWTKQAKTVFSPVAAVRNIVSNVGFAIANGHYSHGFEALKATVSAMNLPKVGRALDTDAMRDFLTDLTERGVIGQSTHGGELAALIRDAGTATDVEGLLTRLEKQGVGTWATVKRGGRAVEHAAHRFYALGDDLWKINGYLSELDRLKKAVPFADEEALKGYASRIIQNHYPTYSRIPEAVRQLRRLPIVGPFPSWPAEIIRTTKNLLGQTARELRDPESIVHELAPDATPEQVTAAAPRVRGIGRTRLAGALALAAGVPGVAAASRLLTGVSRKDEADLRLFLPEWQRDHTLLHLGRNPDGTYRMVDLSYSDAHSMLREPLMTMLGGGDWATKLEAAGKSLLEPFTQEEILAGAVLDVARNTTKEGFPVTNPQAPWPRRALDKAVHFGLAVEPGALSSARRVYRGMRGEVSPTGRAYEVAPEIGAVATGQRVSTVSIPQALGSAASEYLRGLEDARQILSRVATRQGTVSRDELRGAARQSDDAQATLFRDMATKVQAARRLQVSPAQLIQVLDSRGLNTRQVGDLLSGVYLPNPPSPAMTERPAERTAAATPGKTAAAFRGSADRASVLEQAFTEAMERARARRSRRPQ